MQLKSNHSQWIITHRVDTNITTEKLVTKTSLIQHKIRVGEILRVQVTS